jgi:hypothetical protein
VASDVPVGAAGGESAGFPGGALVASAGGAPAGGPLAAPAADPGRAAGSPAPAPAGDVPVPGPEAVRFAARPLRRTEAERGLRGLVGAGPSQVGVSGALRARDAARPRPEDIAAAEAELVIVRRNYVPPDPPRTDA